MFKVQSQQDSTVLYTVDIIQGTCECRIGSSGSFCKHQCRVVFHYNVDTPNVPRMSDDDRYTAATVALGDDCEARQFYRSLRGDASETPARVSAVCSDSVHDASVMEVERDEAGTVPNDSDMNTDEARDTVLRQWLTVSQSMERKIAGLTDANWDELRKSLETFDRRQQNVTNASQLTTFFSTVGSAIPLVKRAGAMIGVQLTTKARRADNKSRGNRTLSYGRNAKVTQLLTQARKRKASHCIARNVACNVANYRKH